MTLSLDERRSLTAARGWMDLGNDTAAFDELENLDDETLTHPEVLKIRWEIYNNAGKHGSAFVVAEGLTRRLPNDPEVFIWRAHSARFMEGGSVEHAMELILEVASRFPDEPGIPFSLACYNSCLGNLKYAKSWLQVTSEIAEGKNATKYWKMMVLNATDLAAVRKEFAVL